MEGVSKLGALLRGGACGRSSGTPKDIMSTMLETSFAIRSGNACGKSFPTSFKLQRYIAKANSGKSSCPDFVVSDNTLETLALAYKHGSMFRYHICIRSLPGSLDRTRRSLTLSPMIDQLEPSYIPQDSFIPLKAWPSPTADLNSCSNFA